MNKQNVYFDTEVYSNYFYALFVAEDGRQQAFRMHNNKITGNKKILKSILANNRIISFNGIGYDLPILGGFLAGFTNNGLKSMSDTIIREDLPWWELADRFPAAIYYAPDHIDLVGVTPLRSGLKTYGCRIHASKLQDLPIEPDAKITEDDIPLLEKYCYNDVMLTKQIHNHMQPQIQLRRAIGKQIGSDVRSKSDPQIAEAILKTRLTERGVNVTKRTTKVKPFKYTPPDWVSFESTELNEIFNLVKEATFRVNNKGSVILPESIDKVIEFAGAKYKLGIGGLHSQEKKQVIIPKETQYFGEYDVTSFYPSIIIGNKLYPEHLGGEFIEVYRGIFNERVAAKKAGNKVVTDTLKLCLNGSYGKFGSKYSFLYSPELLIQTTLTGQLSLLMLIEWFSDNDARVTSANTDGINILFDKAIYKRIDAIAKLWQEMTGYGLEWTPYKATYSESVNSYIAIKPDGLAKTKGLYESGSIGKGYSAQVCNKAITEHLITGRDISDVVHSESDIRSFLVMRGVTGGAIWRENEIGKTVRWYYATDGESITYKKNGNKVATSDGAWPMMDLKEGMPDNLNYTWYIDNAYKKLGRLGL